MQTASVLLPLLPKVSTRSWGTWQISEARWKPRLKRFGGICRGGFGGMLGIIVLVEELYRAKKPAALTTQCEAQLDSLS